MSRRKTIGLIAIAEVISDAFASQLQELFGDRVKIKKYLLDNLDRDNINLNGCDVLLASSKGIYKRIKELSSPGVKVIAVRRAINLENISEIFRVTPGTRVLVVSNYRYTAQETVDLLQELGIDHLNYNPYIPGDDYNNEKVAITPGGKFLVPPPVDKVIDIGIKLIDVSTIIEILLALRLSLKNSNFLIASYTKKLVNLNRYSTQLNMVMESILSTSHDGIIAVTENDKVMFINKTAGELLSISPEECINRKITDVLDDDILQLLEGEERVLNELVNYQDKYLLVNKEETRQYSMFKTKVLSFKDVTRIQKQEYEIRKKMRKKGFVARYKFNDIIGISDKLKKTVKIAKRIADNDYTVLIKGESGTGKELFAQAIHNKSRRRNNPFIAVNFAALSDSLIESELFGYEGGAFTGARKGGKPGLFEQAHTGTIFIDEIGDASPVLQARLLRVLQEKEIMRVGGNSIIPVDVRVIAATNKNLQSLVDKNKFRKDLYYRLKVLYFTVPPLRSRTEDIYFLINYFLQQKKDNRVISEEVYARFRNHDWPGNVRELENIVNYLTAVVADDEVKIEHLPDEFKNQTPVQFANNTSLDEDPGNNPLERINDVEEYIAIMKCLYWAQENGKKLGRRRISDHLQQEGFNLTAEMVRSRLKYLAERGFVEIGKTRQGSKLTARGREIIRGYI